MEEEHVRLSGALRVAANQATGFAMDFSRFFRRVLAGDLAALNGLRECVLVANYVNGGIVCAPLYLLGTTDPEEGDVFYLLGLRQAYDRFVVTLHELCAACHVSRAALRPFRIRFEKVFTREFLSTHEPWFVRRHPDRRPALRADLRKRIVLHLCATVRRFFGFLVDLVDSFAAMLCTPAAAEALPCAQLRIAPPMEKVVAMADQKAGALVLRTKDGALQAFAVPPGRTRVWAVLRQLIERCGEDGAAPLPDNYAPYFLAVDAHGNVRRDDVARLYRHIIPVGNGRYRLSSEEKPTRKWGRK